MTELILGMNYETHCDLWSSVEMCLQSETEAMSGKKWTPLESMNYGWRGAVETAQ
jgi:hypothetical protein